MVDIISSAQNPKIKLLLELQQKSQERRRQGLFVVEGRREIERCIQSGYQVDTLFWCPEIFGIEEPIVDGARVFQVSADIYNKVAYLGGTEGVIAEVVAQQRTLDSLKLQKRPLIVVLESVEKPGNVGAILRSADAANVDAVIVCAPQCDLYNPNIIRASVGAFFSVPTVACTSEECIQWLKDNGVQILTAQLQDSYYYYETDMVRSTAIVMGTEATGLTDKWRQAADAHIKIPMLGIGDSLNVSVSAAILMFEAVRQRSLHVIIK